MANQPSIAYTLFPLTDGSLGMWSVYGGEEGSTLYERFEDIGVVIDRRWLDSNPQEQLEKVSNIKFNKKISDLKGGLIGIFDGQSDQLAVLIAILTAALKQEPQTTTLANGGEQFQQLVVATGSIDERGDITVDEKSLERKVEAIAQFENDDTIRPKNWDVTKADKFLFAPESVKETLTRLIDEHELNEGWKLYFVTDVNDAAQTLIKLYRPLNIAAVSPSQTRSGWRPHMSVSTTIGVLVALASIGFILQDGDFNRRDSELTSNEPIEIEAKEPNRLIYEGALAIDLLLDNTLISKENANFHSLDRLAADYPFVSTDFVRLVFDRSENETPSVIFIAQDQNLLDTIVMTTSHAVSASFAIGDLVTDKKFKVIGADCSRPDCKLEIDDLQGRWSHFETKKAQLGRNLIPSSADTLLAVELTLNVMEPSK